MTDKPHNLFNYHKLEPFEKWVLDRFPMYKLLFRWLRKKEDKGD